MEELGGNRVTSWNFPSLIFMSSEQHPSVLVAFGSDLLELQNLFFSSPSNFSFGSGCFLEQM